MIERALKRISKKARKGFRGYPVATIAFYGPTDAVASKTAVGIIPWVDAEPDMQKWFSTNGKDIRDDPQVAEEILTFIEASAVKSVVMPNRIIGCPHEEDIDYEGPTCPVCSFWAGRDRFAGKSP
jgi:hypothetical protein